MSGVTILGDSGLCPLVGESFALRGSWMLLGESWYFATGEARFEPWFSTSSFICPEGVLERSLYDDHSSICAEDACGMYLLGPLFTMIGESGSPFIREAWSEGRGLLS